ncbi:MAG: Metalloprotease MmpA [Alphaproteobacteria bacterium MarineAlpha9_Bin2]|nr:MAG: Metalloprotease MmpA [Alphaproteobacteria bacterium MarineAlpha9_Bin2]
MILFWFLLLLTVIVFVHELGHYLVARYNGVKVEVFSIGFGKELFGFNDKSGTRWKFSLIPIGGYVKFFGDINVASSPDKDLNKNIQKKDLSKAFHNKNLLQKSAIVVAGPFANFLFAVVLFFVLFQSSGIPISSSVLPIVDKVLPNSAASKYDIKSGDEILKINGIEIKDFMQIRDIVISNPNKELNFLIKRNSNNIEIVIVPDSETIIDNEGNEYFEGKIGVVAKTIVLYERVGVFKSLGYALESTYKFTFLTLKGLKEIVMGERSASEIGGPIMIANEASKAAERGAQDFIWIMAIISINLGLINLFPIPLLDGGHLLFFILQAILGKPLKDGLQEYASSIGIVLIIGITLLVFYNDIVRYFF